MPQETLVPLRRERDPHPDSVIIGVTTSPRRQDYLRSLALFAGYRTMFVSGPNPELDHPDMVQVAKHKAEYVLSPANPNHQIAEFAKSPSSFVIAADVRTRPLILHSSDVDQRLTPDRPAVAISLGKPQTPEDVRHTLGKMSRAAKRHEQSYYEVESGTYIIGRGSRSGTPDSVTAVLDSDLIQYFSTNKGFSEYLQGFFRFYSTEEIRGLGKPKLTDVAGGLSLGTLLSLGAVKNLDGIEREDPRFRNAVKSALNKALFGFNSSVMKQIVPNIADFVDSYPLLEAATNLAVSPRKI